MVVVRYFSLILLVIALMLLGADIVTSLEKNEVTVRTVSQVWAMLNASSLASFKAWLAQTVPGAIANGADAFLDNVYSWAPFGVIGAIVAFLLPRPASYQN